MATSAGEPAASPPPPSREAVIAEMIKTSLVGFQACSFTYPDGSEKDGDDALESFDLFYRAMTRLHTAAKKAEGRDAPDEHAILREQIADTAIPKIYHFLVSLWNGRKGSRNKVSFAHKEMLALSKRYAEAPKEEPWPEDALATAAEEEEESVTDLKVEVLSAHDLGNPEYRVGDVAKSVAKSLFSGRKNRLEKVYATVKLGAEGTVVRTSLAKCPGDSEHPTVHFYEDRHYINYRDERELTVEVYDKRDVQAALRGDPKVGHGTLPLPQDAALDDQAHTVEIPLVNGDANAGMLLLRYRFMRSG